VRLPARRRSVNPLNNRYSAGGHFPGRGATRTAARHPPGGPEPDRDRPVPGGDSTRRFPATSRYPAGTQRPAADRSPRSRCPGARRPGARSPRTRSLDARSPGARSPGTRSAGSGQPPASTRSLVARSPAVRRPEAGRPRPIPRPPTATPRRPAATTAPLRPVPATTRFLAGRARASPAWSRPRTRRDVPGPSSHPSRALSFSLALAVVLAGACVPLRPPPPGDGDVGLIRTGEVDRAGCDIAVTGPLTSGYSPSPTGEGQARSGLGGGPQAAGGPAGRGCAPAVVTIHARTRASSCHLS